MTTQFPDSISDRAVTMSPTASRVTPQPSRPFVSVLNAGASAVIEGAEVAAQRIPGGPLVAAAVRPGATANGVGSPAQAHGAQPGGASGSDGSLESVIQTQAENSLYYLQLQQQIQEETRTYSTLSNVLKARHETVKNAIGNIR